MSTVVSELAGALITSAAPEFLPMIGTLAGKMFGVPAVSRIAAGTVWNLCNKKSSPSDVEMRTMDRSFSRGSLRGRTLNRGSLRSPSSRWESSRGIRFSRTEENKVVRSKQRFVGLIAGGQTVAALTLATMALLSHFAIASLALTTPVALGIALALAINAFCSALLADHYAMDKYTFVPEINDNNWDKIDLNNPLNQSNLTNTFWFGLSSLFGPLACLNLLLSGAGDSYEERQRYMNNN